MFILVFTDFDIFLSLDKNLLEFFFIIRLAVRVIVGIEFFVGSGLSAA